MLTWIAENTLVALALAGVVALICLFNRRRPALCHLLWVLTLVVLLAPALPVGIESPGEKLRQGVFAWLLPAQATEVAAVEPADPGLAAATAASSSVQPISSELASGAAPKEPGVISAVWTQLSAVSLATWAMLAWGLGSLIVLTQVLARMWAFDRRVRAAPEAPPALVQSVARTARLLEVSPPPVRLLEGVGTPSVWCLGRPVLLWPTENGELLESAQEPSLIAHELAHLARRDHWVAWFEVFAMTVCWWNPVFWGIRRQVRAHAELACDGWATWAYPSDRRVYAAALIDAQERTARAPVTLQGLCATDTEFRDFERRLSMIMKQRVSRGVSRGVAALAVIATLLILPVASNAGGEHARRVVETTALTVAQMVEVKELTKKAETLFKSEKLDEALPLYRQVLELDSENGLALNRIGFSLAAQGDHRAAAKYFEREVKLGHSLATATYNIACMKALDGDGKGAQAALTRAVQLGFGNHELMAKDPDLASIRGAAAYESALANAQRLVELKREMKIAKKEEREVSLETYEALTGILIEDGELAHAYGLALLRAGNNERAEAIFTRQAELGYSVANAYYNRACSKARNGDTTGAMRDLERAVKKGMAFAGAAEDEDLEALRGDPRFERLSRKLEQEHASKVELKAAVAADGESAEAALREVIADRRSDEKMLSWANGRLGQVLAKEGRHEEAIAQFEKAIASGYSPDWAAFSIASSQAAMGREDEAAKNLDYALALGFNGTDDLRELLGNSELVDATTAEKMIQRSLEQGEKYELREKKEAYEHQQKQREEAEHQERREYRPSGSTNL